MPQSKPRNLLSRANRSRLKKLLPKSVYYRFVGRHDDQSRKLWLALAADVAEGQAILDIGALRGVYSLAARTVNHKVRIFAFEPNPGAAGILRQQCEPIGIEVVEYAVSDRDGTTSFLVKGAGSRVVEPGSESSHIEVACCSLDSWVVRYSVIPAMIKIDVEGGEARVLRGAESILATARPVILCEVLSDQAGEEISKVLPPNYLYYCIDENRGMSLSNKITRKQWRNMNWLLVPEERQAEIESIVSARKPSR